MDNKLHQEAVKEAVKSKFKGSQPLKCRTVPKYPNSAEREFKRVATAYMKLLNVTLKKHLPDIMSEYSRERRNDSREDGIQDFTKKIRDKLLLVAAELEQKIAEFGLNDMIEKIASMTRKTSLREWKRAVRDTLGIDLIDDYYKGEFYSETLRRWTDDNVLQIKTIPANTLDSMKDLILNGYLEGQSTRELSRAIQREYDVSKHKAQSLARDQVSSLNSQISKMQQQDAGCSKYRWSSSNDSRVRDCHRSFNGKIFSWDDPPEMWYETKKSGRVYTGRRCHPGEDYLCRCVAIPIFDFATVNVPMKGGD